MVRSSTCTSTAFDKRDDKKESYLVIVISLPLDGQIQHLYFNGV